MGFKNKMSFRIVAILAISAILVNFSIGSYINEIRTYTASCADCGMTFLGELSVKVCAKGPAPAICCVASNLDNAADNFNEGMEDIFTGIDLRECYNFDLGNVSSSNDFSLTIYHALSDGGKFGKVSVITNDYKELSCEFERFLDGSDWENGQN